MFELPKNVKATLIADHKTHQRVLLSILHLLRFPPYGSRTDDTLPNSTVFSEHIQGIYSRLCKDGCTSLVPEIG
jgi:hypothetical protein